MKIILSITLLLISTNQFLYSQDEYHIWEGLEKPYYKENNLVEYEKEMWRTMCVFNVTEPTLTVYKAIGENTGKSVVILPGGGYELVAVYLEGHDLARVLAKNGITAAVLKYRLPDTISSDKPNMVPLTDTRRALKLMHEMSEAYGIDKNQIGLVGFSAGSHLATVVTLWESTDPEENPDFSSLIYGVTILTNENQKWLEETLYYRKMTTEEIAKNRLLKLVSENTPPAFLVHAYDDEVCNVIESTAYANKLLNHEVLVEMHLFTTGGHGFGLGRVENGTNQWVNLFVNWLNSNSF